MLLFRLSRLIWMTPLMLVGACSGTDVLNTLANPLSYQLHKDIPYGPHPRQKLDIYRPIGQGGKPLADTPVVVFFYGGSWNRGNRQDYLFVGEALSSRGFTTVIADYRLYPEVKYPDFLDDCAKASSWVYNTIGKYGGKREELFAMGHSAGAYNASMIVMDPRWLNKEGKSTDIWKGWIGVAGPYDFLPINTLDVRPVFHYPNSPPESQPIRYVSANVPATLLIAPKKDVLLDTQRNTEQMTIKLRDAGVTVTEKIYPQLDHVTAIGSLAWPLRFKAPVLDDIEQFIKKTSHDQRTAATAAVSGAR